MTIKSKTCDDDEISLLKPLKLVWGALGAYCYLEIDDRKESKFHTVLVSVRMSFRHGRNFM